MEPHFRLAPDVVRGASVTRFTRGMNDARLIHDLIAAEIESTEYHSKRGSYLPLHQFLTESDRKYIMYHVTGGVASIIDRSRAAHWNWRGYRPRSFTWFARSWSSLI